MHGGGEHTAVIPYASIQAGDEPPAGARVLLEAKLVWAGDVLGVAHVAASDVIRVGDLGLETPGSEELVVARRDARGELSLVLPGGKDVPRGSRMTLRLGRTMLRLALVADDVEALPRLRSDRRVAFGVLAAAALHAVVIASLFHGRGSSGAIEETERAAFVHYMAAAEARAEADVRAAAAMGEPSAAVAGQGSRDPVRKGERGMAGIPTHPRTDRRARATRGGEPRAAEPGAEEVSSFGMLALLDGEGARAGSSPFAADVGRSAMGNLFGTTIGDAEGFAAVDLSGTGEGGGGTGAGISMHGVGAAAGFGAGTGAGRAGRLMRLPDTHRMMSVSCRCGETQVSGRLPPEAVQRVVRASFGRFRACYEEGLRRDPGLEGRVDVRFVIGRAGTVEMASAGGALADSSVRSCIAKRFEQLSFPEPTGGIVTVVYPLVLSPM
jgi:hypothetical protein